MPLEALVPTEKSDSSNSVVESSTCNNPQVTSLMNTGIQDNVTCQNDSSSTHNRYTQKHCHGNVLTEIFPFSSVIDYYLESENQSVVVSPNQDVEGMLCKISGRLR